jgi:hypothetical protein
MALPRGARLVHPFRGRRAGEHHRVLTGIITEARLLRDDGRLSGPDAARLDAAYAWFNDHLPDPPFEDGLWPRDAVAWFKDDAGEPVSRMWEIVSLLRDHGSPVRLLRSRNPGRALYEDQFQVVVTDWNRL